MDGARAKPGWTIFVFTALGAGNAQPVTDDRVPRVLRRNLRAGDKPLMWR